MRFFKVGVMAVILLLGISETAMAQACPTNTSTFSQGMEGANGCAPNIMYIYGTETVRFPIGCTADPNDIVFDIDWGHNGPGTGPKESNIPFTARYITSGTDGVTTTDRYYRYHFNDILNGDAPHFNHTYPQGLGDCKYTITYSLKVRSTNTIIISRTLDMVTYHQTDDYYGTQPLVMVEPNTGRTVFLVCFGQAACIRFQDVSRLNCNPATESPGFEKNSDTRYIQFEYGTNGPSGMIPGITVAGQAYTNTSGGRIPAANRLDGGYNGTTVMANGTYRTIDNPGETTGALTNEICVPNTTTEADVGKEFRVTLYNWNKCNPGVPNRGVAIQTEAIIRIVAAPPPPDDWSATFCNGNNNNNNYANSAYAVTLTHDPGAMTPGRYYYFLDNGSGTGPSTTDISQAIYTNTARTGFNPVTLFATTHAAYLDPKVAKTTIYWVVYEGPSNGDIYQMNCMSKPAKITYTIREDISGAPRTPSGTTTVCANDVVRYTVNSLDPTSLPIGGAITYVWEAPAANANYTIVATEDGNGSTGRWADIRFTDFIANSASTAPRTVGIKLHRRWTTAVTVTPCAATECPYCYSATFTHNITVNPRPSAVLSGGGTICADEQLPLTINTFRGAQGTTSYDITLINGETLNGFTGFSNPGYATMWANPPNGTSTSYLISSLKANPSGCTNTDLGPAQTVIKRAKLNLSGNITGLDPVCAGSSNTYTLSAGNATPQPPVPEATEYYWTWNGSAASSGTSNSRTLAAGTATNNTTPATRNIEVIWRYTTQADKSSQSDKFCPSDKISRTITVMPAPIAKVITPNYTVCLDSPAAIQIDLTGTPNVAWVVSWRVGSLPIQTSTIPGTGTGSATPVITIPAAYLATLPSPGTGTFTFTLTDVSQLSTGGCAGSIGSPATANIKIMKRPTATISGNKDLCENNDWDIPIAMTGEGTGTYRVSYSVNGAAQSPVNFTSPTGLLHIPKTLITQTGGAITTVTVTLVEEQTKALDGSNVSCFNNATSSYTITTFANTAPATISNPGAAACIDIPPNITTLPLGGNNPAPYSGMWNMVVGPAGGGTFANPTDPNTTFTINRNGRYELEWTITVPGAVCPPSSAKVVFDYAKEPNQPLAGANRQECYDLANPKSFQLGGNAPDYTIETGMWTLKNAPAGGTASILNPASNIADVTVSGAYGDYVFTWTLFNHCLSKGSDVTITIMETPKVDNIPTQEWCAEMMSTMPQFTSTVSYPPAATVGISWAFVGSAIPGFNANGTGQFTNKITPTNSTPLPIQYSSVRVTADNNGCKSSRDVEIWLKPRPRLAPVSPTSVCAGTKVLFQIDKFLGQNVEYNWTNDNPAIGLAATGPATGTSLSDPPYTYSFTAVNGGDSPSTASITNLTATVAGCPSDPIDVNLTVNPIPILIMPNPQICPQDLVFPGETTVISNVVGTTFAWSYSGQAIGITTPAGIGDNVGQFTAIVNETSNLMGGTVTVTGTANGCSYTDSYLLQVRPRPVIASILNESLCPKPDGAPDNSTAGGNFTAITFSSTNLSSDIIYNWEKALPFGGVTIGTGNPTATDLAFGDNTDGIVHTYTWTVTAMGGAASPAKGCESRPVTFLLNVNPRPLTILFPSNQQICSGSMFNNITFADNALGISTFHWNIIEPASISTGANTLSGSSTITFPNPTNNTTSASVTVPVNIQATSLAGCVGPVSTANLTIFPAPVMVTPPPIDECSDKQVGPITFSAVSGGITPADYTWSISDPSVAQSLPSSATVASQMQAFTTASNNTAVNKQAIVTVFASAGGCNSAPVTFPVTVRPIPKVNPVANQEVCPNVGVYIPSFSTNLTGNDASIISWTLNDTGIAAPPLSASGTNNISSFTSAPNSGNPGTPRVGTFKLVANMEWTTSNGLLRCSGDTTKFTLTVKPSPQFTPPPQTDLEFCHGDFVPSIIFNSASSGVIFNWTTWGDNIGLANTSGTGHLPAFTAVNNTYQMLSAGILNISVTVSASNCASDPMDFKLTVKPVPQLGNYPNVTVCGGVPITPPPFSLNPSITFPGAIEYQWMVTNNWIPESNLPDPALGIQTGDVPNFTPDTSRITYPSNHLWGETPTIMRIKVIPFLAKCEGISKDVYIQLNPLPETNIGTDMDNCVGDGALKLYWADNGVGTPGSKYLWGIENPIPANPQFQPILDNASDSLSYVVAVYPSNNNLVAWSATLTVIEKNSFRCLGEKRSMPLRVMPLPVVSAGPNREVCFGDTVILSGKLIKGGVYDMEYSWFPQTYIIDDETTLNPVVQPRSNMQYQLQASEGNISVGFCKSEISLVNVSVRQAPIAPMVPYMAYCETDPLLQMKSYGTADPNDVVHWQRLYESPSGTFIVNGTPYDSIRISNCDSISMSMQLQTYHPEALPSYPLQWGAMTMDTTILYQLYVTRRQGSLNCKSPMSQTQLTVRRAPKAPESHDFTYCVEPYYPLYALRARSTSANAPIINWYASDMKTVVGSGESFSVFQTGVSPVDTPETSGSSATYTPFDFYAETSTGYCRSPLTKVPLTIYPNPELNFTLNDDKGCTPFELFATNQSSSVFADYHWVWEAGDTTKYIANNNTSQRTYYATGTIPEQARVQLIGVSTVNKNSETNTFCRSNMEKTLIVYPGVKSKFLSTASEGCHPLNVIFTASGLSSGAYNFRWYWDRPDLSPGVPNPPGKNDEPINNPNEGAFYGVKGPNPPHTFENEGTGPRDYHVWLQVDNGACFDSKDTIVTVYPVPNSSFTHNKQDGVCPPDSVMFTNTSAGPLYPANNANTRYAWNFADGFLDTTTIAKSPIYHKYENWILPAPAPYTVMMTAFNQYQTHNGSRLICSSTTNQYLLVNPQVEAKFTGPVDGCSPADTRFQTQSIGVISYYSWDFGDGTPLDGGTNPPHRFENITTHRDPTSYTVTHKVGNTWCSDTYSQPFTLYPQPVVSFVVDKMSGCQPLEVTFTNTSNSSPYPNPLTGMTYIYDYHDGWVDTLYNTNAVKHSFINTLGQNLPVSPVMIAQNQWGCTNRFSLDLTIFPYVKADFVMEASEGCSPLTVNFRNGSQGYATYEYSFGDGTGHDGLRTDNILYSHTYINPSMYIDRSYNVTLRVEAGGTGCWDAVTQQVSVLAKPTADFRPGPPYPAEYLYQGPPIQIDNLILPDDARENLKYLWSWSEQGSSYINNFSSSVYPSPLKIPNWGVFNITQRATAPNGVCFDSKTLTIRIVPPAAQANFDDVPPRCMPDTVEFVNTSRNASAYKWEFGDGHFSTLENPTHVYTDAGTYKVTLTASGDNPFPSTITKTIVVHPTPQAAFEVAPKFLWVGQTLRAYNYTVHMDSNDKEYPVWYRWDWGDNTPSDTALNPSHMYLKAGTYKISLTVGTYTDPQCISKLIKTDAVDLETSGDIIIPNIFKPLVTGEPSDVIQERGYKNYLFYPVLSPVRKYHLVIYSRVGQLLFETNDPKRGWNGYYKGRLCDEGVYTYRIEGVYETGQTFNKMGDVTILR